MAAVLVVFYHLQFGQSVLLPFENATSLFRRSYLFVDLFFILSGFIISYTHDADRTIGFSRGELADFLRARVARLYPLHLFCLAYLVAGCALLDFFFVATGRPPIEHWDEHAWTTLLLQLFLLNSWIPGAAGWNIPSWSISAEFFAYCCFPILVTFHVRAKRLATWTIFGVASVFYVVIGVSTASLDVIEGLAPLRCLAGFSIGMAFYFWRDLIGKQSSAILSVYQFTAGAVALFVLCDPVPDSLIIPAFILLIASTWTDRGLLARLFGSPLLLWLGEISYSIYLNHVPLIRLGGIGWTWIASRLSIEPEMGRLCWLGLFFPLLLIVSHLTYTYIERPSRRWLAQRWLRRAQPVIVRAGT